MNQNAIGTVQTVDLSNCDKEPIHIPGSIQPHGILFVLEESPLKILQVSTNTFEFIGLHPQDLLDKPLSEFLDNQQIHSLQECISQDFEYVNPLKLAIAHLENRLVFDAVIHRSGELLILELEPAISQEKNDFLSFYHLVKTTIAKIQRVSNLQELCQTVVREVQKITGFDRVMIYQFDSEGAGTVIAEEKLEELSPYLGLWYPPSDIPKQAKQLYTLNLLRLIPDVNYQPIALIPAHNPITNSTPDLSLSVLRSVSPIHVEYLKNMEVDASMSISLIRENKLWGLIACHHYSTKFIPYDKRTICEFLGQMMSLEMARHEDNEDLDYKIKLKAIQAKFIESIPQAKNFVESLAHQSSDLLELVGAQGVAVMADNHLTQIGTTPQDSDIQNLIEWIEQNNYHDIFHTNCLCKDYPEAEKFKEIASGLLVLSISKIQKYYILWFRPEVIQTVNWGGNPNKPVEVEQDGSLRLSPRKSFALWQETVRAKSLPWKSCEIEAALELRSAIIGIVLRKADELARINLELARSNSELDAFAYIASHDLKEPLRGIHNYSSFLMEDYAHILDEDGVSKLQTLVRLTQRMEDLIESLLHFSRLGRTQLSIQNTNLNSVVKSVIDVLNISMKDSQVDIRIPRPLPSIPCDRIQVSEVFTNLISNAIKYNDKAEKWVEIGFLDSTHTAEQPKQEQPIIFYVRDNGIGIREKHHEAVFRIFKRLHALNRYGGGTGAGLTIAKKVVERHGGTIWLESTYGEGSTFYFTLHR